MASLVFQLQVGTKSQVKAFLGWLGSDSWWLRGIGRASAWVMWGVLGYTQVYPASQCLEGFGR